MVFCGLNQGVIRRNEMYAKLAKLRGSTRLKARFAQSLMIGIVVHTGSSCCCFGLDTKDFNVTSSSNDSSDRAAHSNLFTYMLSDSLGT